MASTRTETQTSTAGKSSGPAKLNKDPTIAQIFESLEYGPAPEAASSVNSWLDEHGRDFGHFVNGKWVKPEGRKVYETRNPATGQRYFLLLGLLLLQSTSQCLELGADPTTGGLGGHNFVMHVHSTIVVYNCNSFVMLSSFFANRHNNACPGEDFNSLSACLHQLLENNNI